MLASPWLLLLDEPATGLDREGVAWLARTLAEVRERGCTVVMTSHGHSEAVDFATRAIAMRAGAVIADSGANGDVRAILDREIVAAGPSTVQAGTR
jgi:ABC-2 type transport system ATP-binding protein